MALFGMFGKNGGSPNSDKIGSLIEQMNKDALTRRRTHERRWYDNNFFDDGYHFRFVSKKTGRVVDTLNRSNGYIERAIPRASKQIRGVANLLFTPEYYPVVYPERITREKFFDPNTQQYDEEGYKQTLDLYKRIARLRGVYLSTMWEDELDLPLKLIDMLLLAAKNSIAYIQVYTDAQGKLCAYVFDAFDLIHYGDKKWLNELPFMTKACPWDLNEVKSSPMFDPSKIVKLDPDNQYATSEIKNAYMRARFGTRGDNENQNTIIVRETFIQEYLTDENWKQAIKLSAETGAMEGKSKGDMIMRHPFSAGGVTLKDEYVNYDSYPFAEFRYEPGYLYQAPLIERFIPLNKSLDVVVTRLEKWINAMVVGVYMQRKGENFQINNFPGGQKIEYETTPPTQMQTATTGQTPFAFLDIIDKYIEEQGASTFTLNKLPAGVTANAAFESSQQREYMNMKVATKMLKKTITDIAKLTLERTHKDMIEPQEIEHKEDGKPEYFTVIGKAGYQAQQKVNNSIPDDIVVIDKDVKVRVEIEPGLGLTMAGKRESMNTVITKAIELTTAVPGSIPPEALQMMIKRFLETFGWGSTQELMETMEEGMSMQELTEEQITRLKIALAETMKDLGVVGKEADDRLVDSTKLGTLEAMKDAGLLDDLGKKEEPEQPERNKVSIAYKDLPADGKAQAASLAGIQLNPQEIANEEAQKKAEEMQLNRK
jgi:hypothetical protein